MLNNTINNNIHRFLMHNADTFFEAKKHSLTHVVSLIRFKFFEKHDFYNHLDDVLKLLEDYCDLGQLADLKDVKAMHEKRAPMYQEAQTLSTLKSKYRALANVHNVSFVFSRSENKMRIEMESLPVYDRELYSLAFVEDGDDLVLYIANSTLNARLSSLKYAVDYFLEYAKLRGMSTVTIKEGSNTFSDAQILSYINSILSPLGFSYQKGQKTFSMAVASRNPALIEKSLEAHETMEMFHITNPSFEYKVYEVTSVSFTPINKGFDSYYVEWQGFSGVISFSMENDEVAISESKPKDEEESQLTPQRCPLNKRLFPYLILFLNEIKEKRAMPNLLHPPTNKLDKLVTKAVGIVDYNRDYLMGFFINKGHNPVTVEDEAAKLTSDYKYYQYHLCDKPKPSSIYNNSVRYEIIRVLDSYLVLFKVSAFNKSLSANKGSYSDTMFRFAVVDNLEAAFEKTEAFNDEFEAIKK